MSSERQARNDARNAKSDAREKKIENEKIEPKQGSKNSKKKVKLEIEGNTAEQEGGSAAEKEGGSAAEKEGGSAAEKEGENAAEKEGESAAEKEGGSAAEKEGGGAAENEGESAAEERGGSAAEKEGGSAAEKEGGGAAENEGESAAEERGGSAAEKKSNKNSGSDDGSQFGDTASIHSASSNRIFVEHNNLYDSDEEDIIVVPHHHSREEGTPCCYKRHRTGVYYGPPNARIYRLEWSKSKAERDLLPNVTRGRYGEMKDDDGNFKYGYENVVSFTGIILEPVGNDVSNVVASLNPENHFFGQMYPDCPIQIKWDPSGKRDGNYVQSWETRTTVRRLYNQKPNWIEVETDTGDRLQLRNPSGDKVIFDLAKEQEARHEAWKARERASTSRSPTPFKPARQRSPTPLEPARELSIETTSNPRQEKTANRARARKGHGAPKREWRASLSVRPKIQSAEEFKKSWCDYENIELQDITKIQDGRCRQAWYTYCASQ